MRAGLSWDADLTATPLRRGPPSLAQVTVGDETVLYVEETDRTHHLNEAATTVWQCLDGHTSLGELAADVAAVTGWSSTAVEADLVEVVRGFGRDGLLADTTPTQARGQHVERHRPDRHAPGFVPVPRGKCTERSDLPWTQPRAVRVGRYVLGVRSGSAELDRLVSHLLQGHLAPGVEPPPNCSLRLASTDGVRFHRMFRGCETSVRTRSLRRLLRALCGFLAEHAAEQDATAVHVDALVLLRGGQAYLLPPALRPVLPAEDALCRQGFRVLDAATAALDPDGSLVVGPPLFGLDEAGVAEAAELAPEPPRPLPPIDVGRYPVHAWAHIALAEDVPRGPARVVADANRRVRNRTAVGAQTALSALTRVASNARLVEVPAGQPTSATLDQLADPAGHPG